MNQFLEAFAPVWIPHQGQREFLDNDAKVKVLACGRRWGKTDACAVEVLRAIQTEPSSRHFLVAPTQDQAAILFGRVVELLELAAEKAEGLFPPHKLKQTPYPKLRIGNHVISARSGHTPRSLRGYGATHVIVDEAAYLPESLLTEVLWPMLATTNGRLTLLSTPHGMNAFWRFFMMGQAQENGIWSRHGPSSENPLITESFLAVQRELISERAFAVEYEAQFMESADAFFLTEVIQRCLTAAPMEAQPPFAIGIDWARSHDFSAVAVLSGPKAAAKLIEIRRLPRAAWSSQIGLAQDLIRKYPNAVVICDATGIGGSVSETLIRETPGATVRPFVFTMKSKSGVLSRLNMAFEHQQIAMPADPNLLRELANYRFTEQDSGATTFGGAPGYHDDLVIALALAYEATQLELSSSVRLGDKR